MREDADPDPPGGRSDASEYRARYGETRRPTAAANRLTRATARVDADPDPPAG